jgi:2,4-dienoyl-CoA reductase-like NADH-dependent reductase (Old Yellow Enzyme family)/thioredoxin reductase
MKLFEPIEILGLTLRNRIIMSSMLTHFASINGEVSDRLVAYHEERAKGGVGLIFPEAFAVDDSGLSYFPGVSIAHDKYIKGLRKLTDTVHKHGGCIGAQLGHAGRFAQPEVSRQARPLVSFIPGWCPVEDSRVMDEDDILHLVDSFIAAAVRAANAGFDIVEIHGAHGYLIAEFLSPFFNRRKDRWGGSLENRLRFPRMIIEGIRQKLGADFPISFRISSEEFIEGGLKLEDSIEIAKAVVGYGVNLVHVSAGIIETNRFTGPSPALPMGWNASSAEAFHKALEGTGALVSIAGRIHDGKTAETILAKKQSDLVSMGRALIADPYLPQKIAEGRESEVVPCLSCNEGCIGSVAVRKPLQCAVNPHVGMEQVSCCACKKAKKVIVVGGGIAGMEAALTASRCGHDVTLYEKTDRLGGLVNIAALPPHKETFVTLIEYYIQAIRKSTIQVVFNSSPSAADLRQMKADVLFIATGSMPILPGFLRQAPAIPAAEVLQGAETGQNVLVLGGGLVGAETAEFLALRGKTVTMLEMRDTIAPDMQGRARAFLMDTLRACGTTFLTGREIQSITEEGVVTVKDTYGNISQLPVFDTMVMALGYRADSSLPAALAREGVSFIPLGDCIRAGKVMTALHQAYKAASSL